MKRIILAILFAFTTTCTYSQDLIKIINVQHQKDSLTTYQAEFRIQLPPALSGVVNAPDIMKAYQNVYNIIGLETIDLTYYAVFLAIPPNPMTYYRVVDNITTSQKTDSTDYYQVLEYMYSQFQYELNNFELQPSDAIIGKKWNGTSWAY